MKTLKLVLSLWIAITSFTYGRSYRIVSSINSEIINSAMLLYEHFVPRIRYVGAKNGIDAMNKLYAGRADSSVILGTDIFVFCIKHANYCKNKLSIYRLDPYKMVGMYTSNGENFEGLYFLKKPYNKVIIGTKNSDNVSAFISFILLNKKLDLSGVIVPSASKKDLIKSKYPFMDMGYPTHFDLRSAYFEKHQIDGINMSIDRNLLNNGVGYIEKNADFTVFQFATTPYKLPNGEVVEFTQLFTFLYVVCKKSIPEMDQYKIKNDINKILDAIVYGMEKVNE